MGALTQGPPLAHSEQTVLRVAVNAWNQCGGSSNRRINCTQATAGLKRALQELHPVVPLPRENWYRLAFNNFDSDHEGYINYESFWQIIKQYHDFHAKKNQERARKKLDRDASRMTQDPSEDPHFNHRYENHVDTIAASPPPLNGSNLEFVSSIVFPSHRGTQQITRNYEIEKESLGEGAFSRVHLARHRQTGQLRVCKTIDITCPAQWELIKQEIELMRTLNHPNILRLHETYHGGYTIFLILELCKGGPMYSRIVKMKQPIMEEQVADWMRQIVSATAFCHEKDIVHRDIKPENIMFVNESDDSPLKVIDFGLSSTLDKIRKTQREIFEKRKGVSAVLARMLPKIQGRPMVSGYVKRVRMQCAGTPHYMAPEMIRGVYNEKCDMFSVGVILYQLLSGKHPFFVAGEDNQETVKHKILNENPPTDQDEWKAVSPHAIHLVKWMLQKDPRKRCSANEALGHVWFQMMSKPRSGFSSQLTPSVFDGLRQWQEESKFKQAIVRLLARELSESEIMDLRKKFEALDRRGDGTITLDELKYSVRQARYTILEADLEKLFKSLDTSGSNKIHYTEFISALLMKRVNFEEAQLKNIFNKFDIHGEGRITVDALRLALKGSRYGTLKEEDIETIFNEIDRNKDGYIDFCEFYQLMAN